MLGWALSKRGKKSWLLPFRNKIGVTEGAVKASAQCLVAPEEGNWALWRAESRMEKS